MGLLNASWRSGSFTYVEVDFGWQLPKPRRARIFKEQLEKNMAEENKSQRASAGSDAQDKFESSKTHARKAAEDLRDAAGAIAGEYRGRAEEAWDDARGRAEHAWDDAKVRVRSFQEETEQYVRENPTKAVFTALGIGFILGLIFRR
jgi:ElaB/YqjD/DUF883 family membrane-anchored ribosome-binding protein